MRPPGIIGLNDFALFLMDMCCVSDWRDIKLSTDLVFPSEEGGDPARENMNICLLFRIEIKRHNYCFQAVNYFSKAWSAYSHNVAAQLDSLARIDSRQIGPGLIWRASRNELTRFMSPMSQLHFTL